jgi:hypothetical protein
MAGTFSRRLHAFCAKQGIPIIEAQAGDRKHELAEPYLPKDRNFCGLFLVIKGIAPAPVWEVKRNADEKLIDRTRKPLDLKQVKTIFGLSYRPHHKAKRGRKQSEIFKAVEATSYDLTVFKIKWRNLTLKIYDKGGRVLRIEVVVHNAKELRAGSEHRALPLCFLSTRWRW